MTAEGPGSVLRDVVLLWCTKLDLETGSYLPPSVPTPVPGRTSLTRYLLPACLLVTCRLSAGREEVRPLDINPLGTVSVEFMGLDPHTHRRRVKLWGLHHRMDPGGYHDETLPDHREDGTSQGRPLSVRESPRPWYPCLPLPFSSRQGNILFDPSISHFLVPTNLGVSLDVSLRTSRHDHDWSGRPGTGEDG